VLGRRAVPADELHNVPQPGTVLMGKYRVERLLGVGGMGAVVEARHLQMDDRVAIKFLLASMTQNQEIVSRFLREGKAAARVRGEHVVRVFDVGTLENGAPYMVMEFLGGSDLAQHLEKNGPLPVATAVDWVLEACEAIADAHAAGIVHRDLKPANLFVTLRSDGTPLIKVLDFGISKLSSTASSGSLSLTKTSAVMGSPRYMSPEQMKSSRNVDARSDVWALGTVLYEALAGVPAFDAETVPELCVRIVTEPPPPLSTYRTELPAGFEAALMGALEKAPAARYQNVAEFAAAMAPFGSRQAAVSAQRAARVLKVSGSPMAVSVVQSDPNVVRAASAPIPHANTHVQWAGSTPSIAKVHGAAWMVAAGAAVLAIAGLGTGGAWWATHRPASIKSATPAPKPPPPPVLPSARAAEDAGRPPETAPPSPPAATTPAPTPAKPPAARVPAPAAPARQPAPPLPPPPKPSNPFDDR
jgi:serine/threonine-protein kinase